MDQDIDIRAEEEIKCSNNPKVKLAENFSHHILGPAEVLPASVWSVG